MQIYVCFLVIIWTSLTPSPFLFCNNQVQIQKGKSCTCIGTWSKWKFLSCLWVLFKGGRHFTFYCTRIDTGNSRLDNLYSSPDKWIYIFPCFLFHLFELKIFYHWRFWGRRMLITLLLRMRLMRRWHSWLLLSKLMRLSLRILISYLLAAQE